MNVVFCDKRDCVFWDVDGICNCVMHDGIPYCKSESIDTKNDAADGLKEENAKLRELADAVKEFVEDTHCDDCPFRRDCDDNNRIFCADDFSYHAFAAMRELGIEVTNG